MRKGKIALLTMGLVLNLVLASCALGRNLRNAATNNPVNNSASTAIPTLVVAPTSTSSNQTSAASPTAQSVTSVQPQSASNDDLDAISQGMQQISEPDVSVDTIETPPSTDDLVDLNGLNQDAQDMQQVLNGLK